MRLIKVLFIIHRVNIGGAEQRLSDFLKYEVNNVSFKFSILCLEEEGMVGRELSKAGIMVHVLEGKNFFAKSLKLRAFLKKEKPDIIHFQLWPARIWTLGVRLFSNAPIIYTVEDQLGYLNWVGRKIEKFFYFLSSKIVVVSNSVKETYCKKIEVRGEKIDVIYNGIELNNFSKSYNKDIREELGISPKDIIVTTVARLHRKKGHIYLVRAAKILKEKYQNLKFVIVGHGDYKLEILKEIKQLQLEGMFIFTGFRRDIKDILASSDMFVLPSTTEGHPVSVVEAMASGKAIITTSIKGMDEVADSSNSILVPPEDHIALAKAIEELINDKEKRLKLGEEARKQATSKFSLTTMCESYEKLYSDCVKKSYAQNILFYEDSSGSGGSTNALVNLIDNLDRKKFQPVVVVKKFSGKIEKINNAKVIKIRNYNQTDNFSGVKSVISSVTYILEAITLYFIIKTNKISLVHINTNIIAGIPAIIAAKIAGIPCVCHIRQTRELLKREKIFAKWIDKFIVLNQYMKRVLKGDVPEEKIEMIYDGIDTKACESKNGGNSYVGIIGRLVEGKGHEDFIKAAGIIVQQRSDARFLVVGSDPSGNKQTESRLKVLADTMGLNGNLTFTGWRDDIPGLISSFDVPVYPYTAPEGLPNVIIETMAQGKPVVSTDMPGPTEAVVNGETGLLVPARDPAALAEAILRLLDNPELARNMGEAGRRRVEELFDITKNVKQIEKLYKSVLENRR